MSQNSVVGIIVDCQKNRQLTCALHLLSYRPDETPSKDTLGLITTHLLTEHTTYTGVPACKPEVHSCIDTKHVINLETEGLHESNINIFQLCYYMSSNESVGYSTTAMNGDSSGNDIIWLTYSTTAPSHHYYLHIYHASQFKTSKGKESAKSKNRRKKKQYLTTHIYIHTYIHPRNRFHVHPYTRRLIIHLSF